MKYSVYDIIYRNDGNIRRLLEADLLFAETGFVAFRDAHGKYWFLYKSEGLLVPGQQEYIDRTYGTRDVLPRIKKVRIGDDECDCSLPPEECAKDFFTGLNKIHACSDWNIERQLWKISGTSSILYDALIRMVRPEQFLDRVSTLRCAYVKEKDTNRRNFTSFEGWEYVDSHRLAPNGKILMGQERLETETEDRAEEISSREADPASAPIWEAKPGSAAVSAANAEEAAQRVAESGETPSPSGNAEEALQRVAESGETLSPSGNVEEALQRVAESGETSSPSGSAGETAEAVGQPNSAPVQPTNAEEAEVWEPGSPAVSAANTEEAPECAAESEETSCPSGNAVEAAEAVGQDSASVQPTNAEEAAEVSEPGSAASPAANTEEVPECVTESGETLPSSGSAGEAAEAVGQDSAPVQPTNAEGAATEVLEHEPASVQMPGQEGATALEAGQGPALSESSVEEVLPEEASAQETVSERRKKTFTDISDLLDCDKRRCRLESYEENMLYDIKRGHWDVNDYAETVEIPEKGKLVPRDPRKDIKTGIVGIDFGTKSTVVVRQDGTSAIIPIRIGAGELSSELRENDYENPTIIECTDLDKFLKDYYEQAGRPETSCDDFFVSYDAYADYRCCPPNEFYAYYADLKQWANHEKENVVVWDKQKNEYRFGAAGSENGKVINPIELYAYYIGMYINNMWNGVYMKYLMSFPVGYSKETRQLIVSSFEKGIKKSLPMCILEDKECMKEFSVRLGISEPAAYAVTALEMSNLDPGDENEQYRYGIFDFGGGTADFGFGIWRGASEVEYEVEGYDYVLECFGADSDVTLGGEKILELLAYAVFKKNRGVARRNKITCSLPFGEHAFLGSETLISNSQIAQRNMSILKEELRPLWHQEENWEQKYRHESGENGTGAGYEEYIEPSLYDIDGNKLPDCRLAVDTSSLISLIKGRIQKGIDAFFKCMGKAFQRGNRTVDYNGPMYIFLAGNSSRSIFVKELFEEAISMHTTDPGKSCFKLVGPMNEESRDEYVPNGKTSVAYGLIKSREGSSIKVVKNFETDAEEQTRFKYYLGRERRHHFDCRLSPAETEYGEWVRFQGAARQTVRIYYTTDPTADVREQPPAIDDIFYKEITIDPQPDAYIFIRACEPSVVEYTVSRSEKEIVEGEIFRIDF